MSAQSGISRITDVVSNVMSNGFDLIKNNRFAQIGLGVAGLLAVRSLWLSIGDQHVYSQPERQHKQLIAQRPRGMRLGDYPEYCLSLGILAMVAKYANVPTNIIVGGTSIGVCLSLWLHRPVQRFRYMWRLTFFMWTMVFGYSALTQYVAPQTSWSLIPVGYLGALTMFYSWHIAAHQPWTGVLFKVHMRHHMVLYPPKRYLSDEHKYSHSFFSLDGFFHEGPLYALILAELLMLKYLYRESLQIDRSLACLLAGLGLFGYLGNQLHYAFHIRGHFMENFDWFLMLRELHWIHHKGDMKKNYMLLNFTMDELFASKDYVRYVNESLAGTQQARENDQRD